MLVGKACHVLLGTSGLEFCFWEEKFQHRIWQKLVPEYLNSTKVPTKQHYLTTSWIFSEVKHYRPLAYLIRLARVSVFIPAKPEWRELSRKCWASLPIHAKELLTYCFPRQSLNIHYGKSQPEKYREPARKTHTVLPIRCLLQQNTSSSGWINPQKIELFSNWKSSLQNL